MLPGAYSNSRVPLPHLNERQRRSMLAAEARFLGTAVCELLPGRLGSARGAAQAATQPGTQWRPKGDPVQVEDHSFFFTGPDVPHAISYGV